MASTQPFALQPIIGMKAEAPELTSDFDDIFSSDGDEQPISIPNPGLSTITHVAKKTNKVTSLIDVAPQLTNLSTLLNDYKFPEKYEGKIDFVPENTAPEDLVTAINSTYESNSYQPLSDFLVHFNIQSLNDTQLCQLRIVQHIYDKEIDLESLISNESDSRVLALLYFALSIDKEPEVEAAFCLNSALEFAKSSSVIPISLFFPNFDLKYITVRICTLLSSLFSKNPLMPSAIGKLSPYVDPKLMEKLTEVVDDSDSDDDFSDSFLEDIQVQRAAAPLFQIDFNQCITNPLDLSMRQISPPCIVLPQAPTTFTFLLANGEESIYGIHFSNWLKDCSSRSDPIESDTGSLISYSEETTNSLPPIHLDQVPSLEKNYDDIYGFFNNPGEKVTIPDDPDFALSLPILHYINSRSDIPCPDSFGESRFFSLEFSAHKSFEKGDSSLYLDTLEKLIKIIPTDIPQSAIRPLNPKRKFPTNSNSDELNEDTKIFMALIDAFLMIEMRSPLTLLQYSFAPKLTDQSHPIFNREWRTKALYHLYITNTYFPYLSFRAAFTIANSLIDTNPEYASRLGFEALYLLLHPFPNLKTTIWCRSTYFLLGESLESVGKYYYCALCHDCALPLTIRSRKMTSKAAQIAHKNHDSIRTVFYYLEALKLFTQSDQNDEALYGTQVLAGIYRENVQYLEGIKLINTILNGMKPKTTSINTKQIKNSSGKFKSLKQNTRRQVNTSYPLLDNNNNRKPENINNILTSATLCLFLIKMHQFTSAISILDKIDSTNINDSITRLTTYLRFKTLFIQGKINELFNMITPSDLIRPRNRTNFGKFILLSFDLNVALLKLLTKASIVKQINSTSLFWAEMLCHTAITHTNSLNEIGVSHLLRAQSLLSQIEGTQIYYQLSTLESSIGKFICDEHLLFTKEFIINETLSSISSAKICFDRVGNAPKHLDASLMYCEVLIYHFYKTKVIENIEAIPITISQPHYLTTLNDKNNTNNTENVETLIINNETYINILTTQAQSCENLCKIIMDPIMIIRNEIILGIINLIKGKIDEAKQYLEFIVINLKKYLFLGKTFSLKQISLYEIHKLIFIFDLLILYLISTPKNIMEKYPIIFEWRNELLIIKRHLLLNKTNEPKLKITSSGINPQPSIYELKNDLYPDFIPIIKRSKVIPNNNNINKDFQSQWRVITLYRKIHSNSKQFSLGKLTETKLNELNTNLCVEIEKFITLNSPPSHTVTLQNTIVSMCIFNHIITINECIPKFIKIELIQPLQIQLPYTDKSFDIILKSGLFDPIFLKNITSLIITQPHDHCNFPTFNKNFIEHCLEYSKLFFANINFDHNTPSIPDLSNLDKYNKGKLHNMYIIDQVLIIISDIYTQFLPFEYFFPNRTVIRFIRNESLIPKKCICLRTNIKNEKIDDLQLRKSKELLQITLSGINLCNFPNISETNNYRSLTFPLNLFNPSHDNSKYVKKYPFCKFLSYKSKNDLDVKELQNDLIILSYSDLCDMSETLCYLLERIQKAAFMFIPSCVMKEAFALLKNIFDRHEKRLIFFENKKDHPEYESNMRIFRCPLQFVATIRETLSEELKVPIPIVVQNYSAY